MVVLEVFCPASRLLRRARGDKRIRSWRPSVVGMSPPTHHAGMSWAYLSHRLYYSLNYSITTANHYHSTPTSDKGSSFSLHAIQGLISRFPFNYIHCAGELMLLFLLSFFVVHLILSYSLKQNDADALWHHHHRRRWRRQYMPQLCTGVIIIGCGGGPPQRYGVSERCSATFVL